MAFLCDSKGSLPSFFWHPKGEGEISANFTARPAVVSSRRRHPVQEALQERENRTPFCTLTGGCYLQGERLWNFDAHRPAEWVDGNYAWGRSTHASGTVTQVLLKKCDLWSAVSNQQSVGYPISFRNHAAHSPIKEVFLTGLHREGKHASIVELKFSSQQKLESFYPKVYQGQRIVARFRGISYHEVEGSVISAKNGCVRTSLKDVLLHMSIFYSRETYIKLEMELFDDTASVRTPVDESSSPAVFLRGGHYSSHSAILVPYSPTLPDDNRVLAGHPSCTPLYVLSGDPWHFGVLNFNMLDSCALSHSNYFKKDAHVLNDEHSRFRIDLDCEEFYAFVKSLEVTTYSTYYEIAVEDKVIRILPYKSGDEYLSIWAWTDSIQSCHKITIEATAFDPCRYGKLAESIKFTQTVDNYCDRKVRISLRKVVPQMFVFYCKEVQILIDIKINS